MNLQINDHFFFDPRRYDFWPLYDTIKQYYPVGIVPDKGDGQYALYEAYLGLQEKGRLIEDNIVNQKNYRERWGKFLKQLKKEVKQPVDGTTGMSPCFSGSVQLEKHESNNFILTKALHFAVSLLGPYYTLYGIDESILRLEAEPLPFHRGEEHLKFPAHYRTTHVVTTSPLLEYATLFRSLQEKIKVQFPSYRFIPYCIYSQWLPGLHTGEHDSRGYVYHALFNNHLAFDVTTRGDTHYGYQEWLKDEGPAARENERQLAQMLHASIRSAQHQQTGVTLHRVWKLRKLNPPVVMPSSAKGHVGFFNAPGIRLLDFTDPATVIIKMADPDREMLRTSAYRVVDEEIFIEQWHRPPKIEMKFTISALTADQLQLILYLHANTDGHVLQGDLGEYVFERVIPQE